jgi:hypothetical protein
MSFTLRVHEYGKVDGSPFTKIIKSSHYIRMSAYGNPPIYIQGGRLYSEGGDEVKNPPSWFWEEVKKLTDKALEEVKFNPEIYQVKKEVRKEEKIKAKSEVKEDEVKVKRPYRRKVVSPVTNPETEKADGND